MGSVFSLRFFAPPILSLIFIGLAYPTIISDAILVANNDPVWSTAILFIIISGFLISTLSMFLINIFYLDIITFNKEEVGRLQAVFPFMKDELPKSGNARELAEWILLDTAGGDYIRTQLQNRWGLFVVNFNSYLAFLFIVAPAVAFIGIPESKLWWFLFILFMFLFFYNAQSYFRNVNDITRLLLKKTDLHLD